MLVSYQVKHHQLHRYPFGSERFTTPDRGACNHARADYSLFYAGTWRLYCPDCGCTPDFPTHSLGQGGD